ncbi:GntR family transcriptional regulator, partial [Streptococcus gordonii]|nr:GntR family transcriptional regulator [Streptococcus gordonii]
WENNFVDFFKGFIVHMNMIICFEEINEIVFPTPKHVAEKLGIDPQFPSVHQVKTTQLESTGQILEYVESYKRGDFYKIKFIASDKSR